jgi:hypothetical protein
MLPWQLFQQPYRPTLNQIIAFLVANSMKSVGAPDGTKQFVKESV